MKEVTNESKGYDFNDLDDGIKLLHPESGLQFGW